MNIVGLEFMTSLEITLSLCQVPSDSESQNMAQASEPLAFFWLAVGYDVMRCKPKWYLES